MLSLRVRSSVIVSLASPLTFAYSGQPRADDIPFRGAYFSVDAAAPSRLPHTITLFAQTDCQLDFHVARALIWHRVVAFIQRRQQSLAIQAHEPVRADAGFMLVEAIVGIES